MSINNNFAVDIPNFSGPLEVLLDLARNQKVDLAEISVATLADQFLDFVKKKKPKLRNSIRIFAYGNLACLS